MKSILFTDTHFGVRQNSMSWLNSQLAFVEHQLIPYIENIGEDVRVIHLGDVFDSRSTISTYVATQIVRVFKKIQNLPNVVDFIIIAGNHDYYSPNSNEVDSISLYFKDTGIVIVNKDILYDHPNHTAYVPWYEFLREDIYKELEDNNIEQVFTHADMVTTPPRQPKGKKIKYFSGHMHTPYFNKTRGIYNLGSCFSIDFSDSNHHRGFYIWDGERLENIYNTKSIRFWRLKDEEIFNDIERYGLGDYIELYISQFNMSSPRYSSRVNEFTSRFKNIWIVPISNDVRCDMEGFEGYDIQAIVKDSVPDDLLDKLDIIFKRAKT